MNSEEAVRTRMIQARVLEAAVVNDYEVLRTGQLRFVIERSSVQIRRAAPVNTGDWAIQSAQPIRFHVNTTWDCRIRNNPTETPATGICHRRVNRATELSYYKL
jgi:hypothetical protein